MADDPWAQFVPKAADDPWAQFVQPTSPAPTASAPSAPPAQDWKDYLLQHVAAAGKSIDDYLTFGYGDVLRSKMPGAPSLDTLRAQTAGAHQAMGYLDPVIGAATYAAGPGELGIASKVGGALAPGLAKLPLTGAGRWMGGVLGSAAEGAGAGALGAAGHGEDVRQGAELGGALGAAGGALGGVVGSGAQQPPRTSVPPGPAPAARTVADLEAAKNAAYAPNDNLIFHGAQEVHPQLDAVENQIAQSDITGQQRDLAKSTMAEVNNLRKKPFFSATDIQKAQERLKGYGATDQDRRFAPQFADALENVMQSSPSYGYSVPGGPGGARTLVAMPGPAGVAAATRDEGQTLFQRLQDLKRLQGWQDSAERGGVDVGTAAKRWLPTDEGKAFTPQGTPQYDALSALARTAGPDVSSAPWYLKHTVIAPLAFGAANEAVNAIGGHQAPEARVGEDLLAFPLLMGGMKGYSAAASALNRAAQRRAFGPAQAALSTGQYQAPFRPTFPLGDALRRLMYGNAAGGAY